MSGAAARPSPIYYLALLALVAAIGAGVGLFWLLTTTDGDAQASFSVSDAVASSCPPGTGATVCYSFDVTNSGGARGVAACAVTPADGSAAVFANDETRTEVSLLPNETRGVIVKVIATGGDVIRPPSLACG